MLKTLSKIALLITPILSYSQGNDQYVNPFIGSDKSEIYTKWGDHGGLYPGAVAPWGMAQLSPETGMDSPSRGYFYGEDNIFYFSCCGHWSGYPNGSAGRLHLMFYDGAEPATSRRLNHEEEHASVGYYGITFDEGDRVEATATARVGLFRYSPVSEKFSIKIFEKGVEVVGDSTLLLERHRSKIHFSRPICGVREDSGALVLEFDGREPLLVKVALSARSSQESDINMAGEMDHWDFERVRNESRQLWEQELSVVDVEGGTEDDRIKFYTALYHSMLIPTIASDLYHDPHYEICSSWDTFRTLHPLLTLLKPDVQSDILGSWLKIYERDGRLPVGPMTGLHTIPIYLDSYIKGIRDFDTNLAAKAMRELWEEDTQWMESYKKYGYVNDSIGRGVSITLDLAYDDWAMAEFLEAIGYDSSVAEQHRARSYNFAHHFDSERLFMTPRDVTTGFVRDMGERGYQETDRWTASWFAPHDVQSLINLYGGNEQFVAQLDKGYSQGVMLHDNEPVLHYPYLYSYAAAPWRASEEVANIMRDNYLNSPGGIPGNDDLGSISSWYVFNAMGIYPICPGEDQYIINTPLFDRVTIKLENGEEFVIEASGDYESMPYFKSVKLNGKSINSLYITHGDITGGGRLEVERSSAAEPSLAQYSLPRSQSGVASGFSVGDVSLSSTSVTPGERITAHFTITNSGEMGSYVAEVVSEGEIVASKHIKIASKEIKEDSITFSFYAGGSNAISFADRSFDVKVQKSPKNSSQVVCSNIQGDEIYPLGEQQQQLEVTLKNISSSMAEGSVPVVVDGRVVEQISYSLSPGEDGSYQVVLSLDRGLSQVEVAAARKAIKVYGSAEESLLLDLEFSGGKVADISGFENSTTLYRGAKIIESGTREVLHLDGGAHLMVAPSPSLDTKGQTLTMMLWMRPNFVEGMHYVDFFTKGDYNSLKMGSPGEINFFTGGWGRGYLEVDVKDGWYGNWHHVVGVCDGQWLRLYIDGEQVGELPIKDNILSTEPPWALGCNAEMPYERNYSGEMDRVRIYAGALTQEQILRIFTSEEADYR